jgi:hypothetical protein
MKGTFGGSFTPGRPFGQLLSDGSTLRNYPPSFSEWTPTGLGEIGVLVGLSKELSLDFGVRYLATKPVSPTVYTYYTYGASAMIPLPAEVDMGGLRIIQGTVGLKYAF